MTVEEFGQTIQAKYPQYASKDATAVGNAMLAKYPQYKSKVDGVPSGPTAPATTPTGQSTPAPAPGNNAILNAGNATAGFLGVQKFGQGLATTGRVASGAVNQTGNENAQALKDTTAVTAALHKLILQGVPPTDLRRLQLVNYLKRTQGDQNQTQAQIDPGTQLSNKEVRGSAANVVLDIVGAGSMAGEGAASGVLSKGGESLLGSSAQTLGGRLLETTGKNAAFGAAQGFAQGMNDNKSVTDSLKQAGTSAVLNAGVGFGVQGLSELTKAITSPQVTEGIVNKTIGTPKNVIAAGKSPAADIIENGVPKTKAGLVADAEATIKDSQSKIDAINAGNKNKYDTAPILASIKSSLADTYKGALNEQDVNDVIKNLPVASLRDNTNVDIKSIDELRKTIGSKYIGNAKWLNGATATPERITALKATYAALANLEQSTHADLPGLFADYTKAITQKTVVSNELAKPHILTNMIEALSSAGVGLSHGGFTPHGAIQGLAGYGAIKTLLSTPVQTGLAIGLDRAGQIPKTTVGQGLKAAAKVITQRVIQAVQKKNP